MLLREYACEISQADEEIMKKTKNHKNADSPQGGQGVGSKEPTLDLFY